MLLLVVLLIAILLYAMSPLRGDADVVSFQSELMQLQFLRRSGYLIQIGTLLVVVFAWVYAGVVHRYDVHLWWRIGGRRTILTKWLTIVLVTSTTASILLAVQALLYVLIDGPLGRPVVFAQWGLVLVAGVHWNALCLLVDQLIRHVFGYLLPLLGALLSFLATDETLTPMTADVPMMLVHAVVPYAWCDGQTCHLMYGPWLTLAGSALLLVVALVAGDNRDA